MLRLPPIVVHPFLFAVFPLMFFVAHNSQDIFSEDLPLIFVSSIGLSGLLFGLFSLVFKDIHKGGLLASVIMLILLSAGQLYDYVSPYYWHYCWMIPIHSKTLYLSLLGLFLICVILVITRVKTVKPVTSILTLMSGYMVLASLLNPNLDIIHYWQHPNSIKPYSSTDMPQAKKTNPDVYYLILDGYPGEGVLKKIFQYDNSPFINALQKQGFYTARYSTSNYVATFLSIASSLNYAYLDDPKTPTVDRHRFYTQIYDSRIIRTMKAKGYRIINFSSGYGGTERLRLADETVNCGQINEFYSVLTKATLLGLVETDALASKAAQQKLCTFKRLGDIAASPGPKFVFAHIVCPHPPYLFGKHGEIRPGGLSWGGANPVWQQKEPFLDQLTFLNTTLLTLTKRILKRSSHPPIIIMQGDHGSAATFRKHGDWEHPSSVMINERMHIFNSYYIPQRYHAHLYPTITPVNSFRVLLHDVYGDSLPMVPDKNWFSSYTVKRTGYHYHDVTPKIEPW